MSEELRIGPIRVGVHERTPEEIRRLNVEKHGGAEYWETDVSRLVEQIRSLRWADSLDAGTAVRWAMHPDERVRVALLGCAAFWKLLGERSGAGREIVAVIAHAADRARSRYELWNPTIEALALAPILRKDRSIAETPNTALPLFVSDPNTWVQTKVLPALRRHALTIEQAKRILSSTKIDALAAEVVSLVRPDPDFVRWLFRHWPAALAVFANRRDLSSEPEIDAELWQGVLAALRAKEQMTAVPAATVLEALRNRNTLPPGAFEELLSIMEKNGVTAHRDVARFLVTLVWDHRLSLRKAAKLHRRLYRLIQNDEELVLSLVRSTRIDDLLCTEIAAETPFHSVRVEIAKLFGHSARVRESLKGSDSDEVLARIANFAVGEELVDILERLAAHSAMRAIDKTLERERENAIDRETTKSLLVRFFEVLIEQSPRGASAYAGLVRHRLGEMTIRTEWVRKIVRGLAKEDPARIGRLNGLGDSYLERLEPEDWIDLLQATEDVPKIVEALLQIPSAVTHREARGFIFRNGNREQIITLLRTKFVQPGEEKAAGEAVLRVAGEGGLDAVLKDGCREEVLAVLMLGPVPPEREKAAALAVLRSCRDFDAVLSRWPRLKAVLGPQDFIPFLRSNESHIRQKAIMLLGDVGNLPDREPPKVGRA